MASSSNIIGPVDIKLTANHPIPAETEEPAPPLKIDPSQLKNKPTSTLSDIPDGGFVAWLQCMGSFLLFFNGFGIINSFGKL